MMCKKVVGFQNFIILGFLVTPDQGSKITPPSFCNPRGRESTLNTTEGIWDTGSPLPTDWVWGKSMPANVNRGPLGEAWGPQERRNEQQWQRNRKCHWGRIAGATERPSIILYVYGTILRMWSQVGEPRPTGEVTGRTFWVPPGQEIAKPRTASWNGAFLAPGGVEGLRRVRGWARY